MPYSKQTFSYTGGTRTFTISLAMGYLEEAHIEVYVVGELDGQGEQLFRTFTFDSEFVVNVTQPIDNPSDVVVQRTVSPSVHRIDFRTGSDLTETNIMEAIEHVFMLMQEILDGRVDGVDIDQRAADAEAAAISTAADVIAAAASAAAAAASAASINLTDFVKKDGSVAFTASQTGVAPTTDLHLATKKYVDDTMGGGGAMLLDGSNQMTGDMLLKAATDPTLDDHAARKKYVDDSVSADATAWAAADALKASLASPALTGNPTAPTATPGDDDTSVATTAFVTAAIAAGVGTITTLAWTFVEDVYDFAVDGVSASEETSTLVDGFEYMLEFIKLSNNDGGNARMSIDAFDATAAAYQGQRRGNVDADNNAILSGQLFFNGLRETKLLPAFHGHLGHPNNDLTHIFSGSWVLATAAKISKLKIAFETSSMDAGVVKLYKRATS